MIPFILHTGKGKTIAAEDRSVLARAWEFEEIVTIKLQEGSLGVIKCFFVFFFCL